MRKGTGVVVHTGIVFVLMTAVTAWAVAQNAAKDDRAATQELMRSVVPKAAYEAILEQTYTQMSATMQQMGGKPIPVSKQKALREAVAECLPYDDLVSWSTEVYLKHFTRKEIDDLAAFYRTPTGKKVAATLPKLSGEIGAVMAPLMMNRMPAALKKRNFEI
jgi:uncharacterized protein